MQHEIDKWIGSVSAVMGASCWILAKTEAEALKLPFPTLLALGSFFHCVSGHIVTG